MMDYFYTYKVKYFIPTIETIMDGFMKEYDFYNITKPDDWHVTYQNSDIVIQFSYCAEYRPNLTLNKGIYIESNNILRGIGFWFVMSNEDLESHESEFTNAEKLKEALAYAKIEIVKYIKPLWENPEILCQKIKENHAEMDAREMERMDKHFISRLDKAWRNRDYKDVIELIESINGELLKSEVMKLEYSKKHLNEQKNSQNQNKPRL